VFKEFPILGPDSVTASRAALAAWKIAPEKYLPFHLALMESRGEMNEARVLETGKKVGIDVDKLKAAMSDPAIKATIDRNVELARKLQINGTPAFIIGGQLVPGAVDLATLREMVATARAT
jgi:protein-disulfide isomerase